MSKAAIDTREESEEPSPTLGTLPFEILSQIASYLRTAQTIRSLSLTCQSLHSFVVQEGWHAFTLGQYPAYRGPPLWRDAAHSLASLSKSWDKRAFNARVILPKKDLNVRHVQRISRQRDGAVNGRNGTNVPTNARPSANPRRRQPGGQTMGFHPVMDCSERWVGSAWADREEVLAVGAGSEILIRSRRLVDSSDPTSGMNGLSLGNGHGHNDTDYRDDHGHKYHWRSLRDEVLSDGRDDISTLKILNQSHADPFATELLVGRVNGSLARLKINDEVELVNTFNTGWSPVRSMDLAPSEDPILAVGLSKTEVAFYRANSDQQVVPAMERFQISVQKPGDVLWSMRFLTPSQLAIGHGVSQKPLAVYELRPEGPSADSLREFTTPSSGDAVYSIAPLLEDTNTGMPGQVFAAGRVSGLLTVHDMRSPLNAVMRLYDPIEAGCAIYSILPVSMQRIVAGTSMHSKLQIYDLRNLSTGGYPCPRRESQLSAARRNEKGYNMFLQHKNSNNGRDSSVYSLAMSNPYSPTIYAGQEGSVMQVDMFSSMDKFPDSVFSPVNSKSDKYANLAMMDHAQSEKLMVQSEFGRKNWCSIWDERWLDSR